jgi:hypothetical protein
MANEMLPIRRKVTDMKRIPAIEATAAVLFLLFATTAPVCAQKDKQEQQAQPAKQQQHAQQQQQQAKPAQQQEQRQQQQARPAQQQQQQDRPAQQQQQQRAQQQQQQDRSAQQQQQQRAQQQPQQTRSVQQQPQVVQRQQQQQQPRNYSPPAQQRTQQQARVWQQQRGWMGQGGWQEHSSWQQDRAQNWQSEHRTWAQRGGYGGYYIPQDSFQLSFGSGHWFRMQSRPMIVAGYPRFQYGGYWFMLLDPWPERWSDNWYATDDVYIGYDNGYYLYNRRDPGFGLAISVVL